MFGRTEYTRLIRGNPSNPRFGLCDRCVHGTEIRTRKGTRYLRCRAPGLPKYPRTPVTSCVAFVGREPRPET
jgi:hypothetical protein